MIASSPLMTMERHSLVAEATPISELTTSIFMPSGLSRSATASAARAAGQDRRGDAQPRDRRHHRELDEIRRRPSAAATSRLVRRRDGVEVDIDLALAADAPAAARAAATA